MSLGQCQIGADIIRYCTIMNDLVDVTSLHLKEIAEDTGEKLKISEKAPPPQIPEGATQEEINAIMLVYSSQPPVIRDATIEELKNITKRGCQNALTYKVVVLNFMADLSTEELTAALVKEGETPEGIIAAVNNMSAAVNSVKSKIDAAKDKEELAIVAEDIDANVPKLKLIRRTWCLPK